MSSVSISDEKLRGPYPLNVGKVDNSKPDPKCGTVQLEFNKTGTLLLARFGTICVFLQFGYSNL